MKTIVIVIGTDDDCVVTDKNSMAMDNADAVAVLTHL